ncbi:MAG: tetratricopeptide repeat protein [Spirochaetales bacterium]|nr:tetratricopeptide repeat protein [Spirochaetales bacterium]
MKRTTVLIGCIFFCLLCSYVYAGERDLFSEAEGRYLSRNYFLALEAYDLFLKEYPLSHLVPDVQFRRSVCFYYLKKYPEALKSFERVKDRYRTTRYIHYVNYWTGLCLFRLKEYSKSAESLNAFIDMQDSTGFTSTALFYKGLSEIYLKDYEGARSSLLRLTNDYRESDLFKNGQVLLAYVYIKLKLYPEVLTLLSSIDGEALDEDKKDRLALYKAEALYETGSRDEAVSLFSGLLDKDPSVSTIAFRKLFLDAQLKDDITRMEELLQMIEVKFSGNTRFLNDFWVQVGIENYKRDRFDVAEHFLLKVWSLWPEQEISPLAPLYLAEISVKNNDLERASSYLLKYLEKEKDQDGILTLRLADICLMKKDIPNAVRYYSAFIRDFPASPRIVEASYYLAYAYKADSNYAGALSIIDEYLPRVIDSRYHREFLKLKITIYKKKNQYTEAYAAIRDYLDKYPQDIRVNLDLLRILYKLGRYSQILTEGKAFFTRFPLLFKEDVYALLVGKYLTGLSNVALKHYAQAVEDLKEIDSYKAENTGLSAIYPFALFYNAWAHYKVGNFKESARLFSEFIEKYPSNPLFTQSLYLAGWAYYSASDYNRAIKYYEQLAAETHDPELLAKTLFFMAKCYQNINQNSKALQIFKKITDAYPGAAFADDALFEYASVLAESGKTNEAITSLGVLGKKYPDSPLASSALYKTAELYFDKKQYDKSRDAFYEYRIKYPGSGLTDAALYWGGLASYKTGEKYGAALVWEKIINDYRDSPFRAEVMASTAEIYYENKDYPAAMKLYTDLLAQYPKEAANSNARQRADEIRYVILGLSKREAELSVVIEQENGIKSARGRQALAELARLYIQDESLKKIDLAYGMLTDLVGVKDDRQSSSQAQFLLGEYYYKKEDFVKAGNEFIKAAVMNPQDRDFMAHSLYKAAQMMKIAGKNSDLKDLVERLEKNFPASQWALEGKKLLEGVK